MRSRTLEITLLLVVLLTKPKSWVLSGVGIISLSVVKWLFEGQAIYVQHWQDLLNGMLNPEIPLDQKLFLIGFFCFLIGASMFFMNVIKHVAIEQFRRFGTKPEF